MAPPRTLAALILSILTFGGATAGTPFSAEIPLYHVFDDQWDHRLGIYAALGGSPTMKLYELDTGSTGLYAADNHRWWPEARRVSPSPVVQKYGSGVAFHAHVVETSVDLGNGVRVEKVDVGRIFKASGDNFDPHHWNRRVRLDRPPLHGVFFGNMGSGLEQKNGLFAVLAQLPGNLSGGFVVETRGLVARPRNHAPVKQGRILVGLTDEIRARFEIRIPTNKFSQNGVAVLLPSGYPAWEEYPIKAQIGLAHPGLKSFQETLHALLDTGAPTTTLFKDKKKNSSNKKRNQRLDEYRNAAGDVWAGSEFTSLASAAPGFQPWRWSWTTGKEDSVDLVRVATKKKREINLGTAAFFQYDVMFDIENGVIGLHRLPTRPRLDVDGGGHRTTSAAALFLHGEASSPAGVVRVEYRLNGGKRWREAAGTAQWGIRIPLQPGANLLQLRATGRDGQKSRQDVEIVRR